MLFCSKLTALITHPERKKQTKQKTGSPKKKKKSQLALSRFWLQVFPPWLPFWHPGSCSYFPAPSSLSNALDSSLLEARGWEEQAPRSLASGLVNALLRQAAWPISGRALPLSPTRLWALGLGRPEEKSDWNGLSVVGFMTRGVATESGKGPKGNSCLHSISKSWGPRKTWGAQTASSSERSGVGGEPGRRGPGRVGAAGPAPRPAPPRPPRGRATLPARRSGPRAPQEEPAWRKAPAASALAPGTRRGAGLAPQAPGRAKFRAGKLGGPGEWGPGDASVRQFWGLSPERDRGLTEGGPAGAERALRSWGPGLGSCPFPSPPCPPTAPVPERGTWPGSPRVPATGPFGAGKWSSAFRFRNPGPPAGERGRAPRGGGWL